jgi:predicted RNA-binding protein (virulence factor B family)
MSDVKEPKASPDPKLAERTEALNSLVGTCDFLKVISVIDSGAFMYCGMEKDLFVPIGEQLKIMKPGEWHVVFIYRDENTGRIAGSSKLNKYLYDDAPKEMIEGETAQLLICNQTEMGYKAVVNNDSWGVLYKNEIFQDLSIGQKIKGYIKKIRPDGRIDLSLQRTGYSGVVPDLAEKIMQHLQVEGGSASFTDKTPPEEIHRLFGVSKKKFKMAIGGLYKQKRIVIGPAGIKLAAPSTGPVKRTESVKKTGRIKR